MRHSAERMVVVGLLAVGVLAIAAACSSSDSGGNGAVGSSSGTSGSSSGSLDGSSSVVACPPYNGPEDAGFPDAGSGTITTFLGDTSQAGQGTPNNRCLTSVGDKVVVFEPVLDPVTAAPSVAPHIVDAKTLAVVDGAKYVDPPLPADQPSHMTGCSVSAVGTSAYVVIEDRIDSSAMWHFARYDVAADSWEALPDQPPDTEAFLSVGRWVVLAAGSPRIRRYDTTTKELTDPGISDDCIFLGAGSNPSNHTIVGNVIYTAEATVPPTGGFGTFPVTMTRVDVEKGTCSKGAQINGSFTVRDFPAADTIAGPLADGTILVAVGTDSSASPALYRYDPASDTWTPDTFNGPTPVGRVVQKVPQWPSIGTSNGSVVWLRNGLFFDLANRSFAQAPAFLGGSFGNSPNEPIVNGSAFFTCADAHCTRLEVPAHLPCP